MDVMTILPMLATFNIDLPSSALGWATYIGGFFIAIVLASILYFRDARRLSLVAMLWMLLLRLSVFGLLAVIAINPHDQTIRKDVNPSQVLILVDRSLSMELPERLASDDKGTSSAKSLRTRHEAISDLFTNSPVISTLQKNHEVSLYSFNSKVEGDYQLFSIAGKKSDDGALGDAGQEDSEEIDWREFFSPKRQVAKGNQSSVVKKDGEEESTEESTAKRTDNGLGDPAETRLGESLHALLREKKGKTLSAVIVISDGQSNIGLNSSVANRFAKKNDIRLVTVGVGSLTRPVNARILMVRTQTDVSKGNPFEITAVVQGTGMAGRAVNVQLMEKKDGAPDSDLKPAEATPQMATVTITGDEKPEEVTFKLTTKKKDAGSYEYVVRLVPVDGIPESRKDDNEIRKIVNITERNLGVLIIAGGPLRDYRFARNMLHRHSGINVDVWLQSVKEKELKNVNQDCDDLLGRFPQNFPTRPFFDIGGRGNANADKNKKKLAKKYDVVIAFDVDWRSTGFTDRNRKTDGREQLVKWVENRSGGLIAVAGNVNTPYVATDEALKSIRDMYPVVLSKLSSAQFEERYNENPYPAKLTSAGLLAKYLRLTDDRRETDDAWSDFKGYYRCFPTMGKKSAATILAEFPDPKVRDPEHGAPILMASHQYGVGRVMYLGNSETWRLREVDEEYFDTLWVKLVWRAGAGRMNRKSSYGVVRLAQETYHLGQNVRVMAYLEDKTNEPLNLPHVTMEIITPNGKLVVNPPQLLREKGRPGYYAGSFQVTEKGVYRLRVMNPSIDEESEKVIPATLTVKLSQLEDRDPRQNVKLLTALSRGTGGRYYPLAEFQELFSKIAEKQKELAQLKETPESATSSSQVSGVEDAIEELNEQLKKIFRDQKQPVDIAEHQKPLWNKWWMMLLLVALLSIEWLTRKLLKLA